MFCIELKALTSRVRVHILKININRKLQFKYKYIIMEEEVLFIWLRLKMMCTRYYDFTIVGITE